MLRILIIALSISILFSCENTEISNVEQGNELIDNRTDLERNIQGKWIDKQDSTSTWDFKDSLVKWNGFTHTIDYSENYFEVGSIRFNVEEKEEGFIFTNLTSKEKHELVKGS